jgi:hypothetical protein
MLQESLLLQPYPDDGTDMLFPDYVAIGVLIVLAVWAVADWIPRDKL